VNTWLLGLSWNLAHLELESTKFARHRALVGVQAPLVERAWSLHGGAYTSLLVQTGALERWGPGAELRLRTQRRARWSPFVVAFGAAHALPHKQVVLRPGETEVRRSVVPEWSYGLRTGLGVQVREGRLEVALDQRWVDAPVVAIPGLHVGVSWSF